MSESRSSSIAEYKIHLALLAIAILLMFYGCSQLFSGLCGNVILSQTDSPNQNLKAVVFRRDCGATTDYSIHVSILNSWEKLSNDDAGNVFSQDTSEPATVIWDSDNELTVYHHKTGRIFTKESSRLVLPFFQTVMVKLSSQSHAE